MVEDVEKLKEWREDALELAAWPSWGHCMFGHLTSDTYQPAQGPVLETECSVRCFCDEKTPQRSGVERLVNLSEETLRSVSYADYTGNTLPRGLAPRKASSTANFSAVCALHQVSPVPCCATSPFPHLAWMEMILVVLSWGNSLHQV